MLQANVKLLDHHETPQWDWQTQWTKEGFSIEGKPVEIDFKQISDRHFHILYQGLSYNAEVLRMDWVSKQITIRMNGKVYAIQLQDAFDQLLKKMGMAQVGKAKLNELKAPMPGLIAAIQVEAGQSVKKGDILLVLEAMKMENALKATEDLTIKSIEVQKGQNVEKNQLLIQFA
ncbi:MAG TPA: acetyl-CoA carboxylase biotin carboxyl carrier protein subunit [Microscillaceae bacterium]|jgi:acetyl/propionyl-CoA carboxylase alpha subunit|nr:acetyl-CoA carboxylase biotin carboxyl carrier protein subunit [Microscillaceae bacterium]